MANSQERLRGLLPLANGDELSEADLRRRIFRFLHGFEARGLRLPKGESELWDVHNAPLSELAATQEKIMKVFTMGFLFDGPQPRGLEDTTPDDIPQPLTFPSLRFGAFTPPKHEQRREFTLIVEGGRLRHLVSYLTMWLLTTEKIEIARCPAPAYRDYGSACHRFFIPRGPGRGRPSKVCDTTKCRARVKAKKVKEQLRRERERERDELKATKRKEMRLIVRRRR